MTFASLDHRRRVALGLALGLALAAPPAAAQQPAAPPDLPPVAGPPVPVAPPKAPPGTPPPQPGAPGAQPVAPYPYPYPYGYGYPPPGLSWASPGEVPPGMAPPAGYAPQAQRTADDYHLPPPPPRRRLNTGMWIGGILVVVGGIGSVITGAAFVSTSANRIDIYCDSPSFPCAHKDDDARRSAGVFLMAAGGVVGAAGIPLWLVGSRLVPLARPGDKPPPGKPALAPELRVGAGTATLTVRF